MSGGSFDYICWKDIDDLFQAEGHIQDMADQLAQLGYAKDAAMETESFLLDLRAFRNRMEVKQKRLKDVWQAVEWWVSGDSGEERIKNELSEYRGEATEQSVAPDAGQQPAVE